ncbi:MAG: hypothetical protein JO061_21570 [Acidobacteriaceae bacterium]|nr:hypothetical protein [Acidobacteriaceae bacterium]
MSVSFLYPRPIEVRLQGGWFDPGVPFSMSFQVRTRRALLDFHSGSLYVSDDQGQRRRIAFADSDPFQNELEYFVDCCHNRAAPVRCPPEKSAEAVKLALMLKRSRDLGGEQLKC